MGDLSPDYTILQDCWQFSREKQEIEAQQHQNQDHKSEKEYHV